MSVTEQRRDGDQSQLTIDYAVSAAPAGFTSRWLLIGVAAAALTLRFRRRHSA